MYSVGQIIRINVKSLSSELFLLFYFAEIFSKRESVVVCCHVGQCEFYRGDVGHCEEWGSAGGKVRQELV